MFSEIINNNLSVNKVKMNADYILRDKKGKTVPYPLPKQSGFLIQISGYSGSGKTTLLMNLLSKKNKNGIRQSYRKLFDDIIFVSPSAHTIKNNPLDTLEETKKFETFSDEVLDKVDEIVEKNLEDDDKPKHTLLILDDVGVSLRRNRPLENRLNTLAANRRHKFLSIIYITQIFNMSPVQLRKNLNLLIIFRPKTRKETESLIDDYFMMPKQDVLKLFDFTFRDKHDFMIIDFTMRTSANIEYFRNYNKIEISKPNINEENKTNAKKENEKTKTND